MVSEVEEEEEEEVEEEENEGGEDLTVTIFQRNLPIRAGSIVEDNF